MDTNDEQNSIKMHCNNKQYSVVVRIDAHKIADECGFTKEIELFFMERDRVNQSEKVRYIMSISANKDGIALDAISTQN